ncbi:Apoptosis-inducing factor 1 [Cytospora mali]|uniref:Apoptosis-inducing factor 1 n=1 Tax=Cytospora mali TaxID=578113 RepID=A0A194VIM2_CYTMA|nr:Apoptosis-inducing factor 1 [Valsa mali]
MAKTVVILGGSYAGLHVAHYLLKQKIPDVKVILVSKSTHLYWNMASVRAIVPGQITDDQLFQPLTAALERYPAETYELVVGAAEKVDTGARSVQVSLLPGGEPRSIAYDQLVVATGSRSTTPTVPWKVLGSYEETVASLDATRGRVQSARHIVVAGAGATGIEVAGELGFEYGKVKEVHLLSGGPSLLDGDSVGPAARAELEKLHVQIRYDARVTGARELPDGKTEVSLASGETITTDLYLPTMGMRANSELLDQKYLGEKGYVVVDESFRVKGVEGEGVWALGDVVSSPRAGFLYTQKQAAGVGKNVELALQGKQPQKVKLMPVDILACAVGRSRGAGRMGPVKMLSLMVWLAKGKTLGIQRLPGYIDGSVA